MAGGARFSVSSEAVLAAYASAAARGDAAALVTVVRAPADSPIPVGARFCVNLLDEVWSAWDEAGLLDSAIADARAAVLGAGPGLRQYALAAGTGVLEAFVEVAPEQPKILIVGAGHIGQALAKLAKIAGFRIALLDDRPEWANRERAPDADEIICAEFEEALASYPITPATAITIITRGHRQDAASLQQVIRSPAGYVGMIGSPRRAKAVFLLLEQEGVPRSLLRKVRTPIGLDLGGETPEEIAVAILAEIVMLRHGGTGRPLSQRRGPLRRGAEAET